MKQREEADENWEYTETCVSLTWLSQHIEIAVDFVLESVVVEKN